MNDEKIENKMREQIENNNSEIVGEIVELAMKTGRWSNKLHHELLFSIINNRFVKGYAHKGLNWEIDYRVYPGNYVLFKVHGFSDDRGMDFEISKVRIDKTGYEITEKLFDEKIVLKDLLNIENNDNTPKILKDFLNSLPSSYHSIGAVPSNEKYSEKIEDVILFLDKYIKNSAEM